MLGFGIGRKFQKKIKIPTKSFIPSLLNQTRLASLNSNTNTNVKYEKLDINQRKYDLEALDELKNNLKLYGDGEGKQENDNNQKLSSQHNQPKHFQSRSSSTSDPAQWTWSHRMRRLRKDYRDLVAPQVLESVDQIIETLDDEVYQFRNLARVSGYVENRACRLFSSYRKISYLLDALGNHPASNQHQLVLSDVTELLKTMLEHSCSFLAARHLRIHLIYKLSQFKLDSRHFHLILMIFLKGGYLDSVKEQFDQIRRVHNMKPSPRAFSILMKCYALENNPKMVLATWNTFCSMWPALVYLHQDAWAIMIDVYSSDAGNQKSAESCLKLFENLESHLKKFNVPLETSVSDSLIRAHGRFGDFESARIIFAGLKLDDITHVRANLPFHFLTRQPTECDSSAIQKIIKFDSFHESFDAIISAAFASGHGAAGIDYFFKYLCICGEFDKKHSVTCRPLDFNQEPLFLEPELKAYQNERPFPAIISRVVDHLYKRKEYELLLRITSHYHWIVKYDESTIEYIIRACIETRRLELAGKIYQSNVIHYWRPSDHLEATMKDLFDNSS